MKALFLAFMVVGLSGCSIFGENSVKTAPYQLIESDPNLAIEVRNYPSLVLVSTSMEDDGMNNAFRRLFDYIAGENQGNTEIAMTAPVFMNEASTDKGVDIAMTAPVFMNENSEQPMMSFVMPADFTLSSTPKPTNEDVQVNEIKDYKVATISFNWTLSDSNVEEHTKILKSWLANNGYTPVSQPIEAAYNGPMTLPMFRKNEIFIEVEK